MGFIWCQLLLFCCPNNIYINLTFHKDSALKRLPLPEYWSVQNSTVWQKSFKSNKKIIFEKVWNFVILRPLVTVKLLIFTYWSTISAQNSEVFVKTNFVFSFQKWPFRWKKLFNKNFGNYKYPQNLFKNTLTPAFHDGKKFRLLKKLSLQEKKLAAVHFPYYLSKFKKGREQLHALLLL